MSSNSSELLTYTRDETTGARYYRLKDNHDPFKILPYKYLKQLGSGSYGQVLLARGKKTKKSLKALKVITFYPGTEQRMKRSFLNEVSILQDLMHPNIVSMYYPLLSSSYGIIIMDYISDGTLGSHLLRLTEPLVHRYFVQIASALSYVHSKAIVHRDVKPNNVLIRKETAYLADFGLSKRLSGDSVMVKGNCGSPPYMAPEVLSADSVTEFDGYKADAFSLGVTLWCMMMKAVPEVGRKFCPIIYKQKMDPTLTFCLRRLLGTNPADRLDVTKLLNYLRQRRYRNMTFP